MNAGRPALEDFKEHLTGVAPTLLGLVTPQEDLGETIAEEIDNNALFAYKWLNSKSAI